jgi:hypothetical protein
MIVEGQTEETFVNQVLTNHCGQFNISVDIRSVETSRHRSRIYRGGLLDYQRAKRDLERWMREDQNSDAFFSTMFDLYAFPDDFPNNANARRLVDPYARVEALEKVFKADIEHLRFIPYIQLHEFEALLLADPEKFD